MPRKPLIRTSEHPYHLRARSNIKDWFDLPLDQCFERFVSVLEEACEKYSLQTHSFVLMSNHWHLVASTPKENVDVAMQFFMSRSSRRLREGTDRINHIYGGRYKWSVISSPEYYFNCHRYVYQNPLRANIVEKVEKWKFSSISKYDSRLSRLIQPPQFGHDSSIPTGDDYLDWLNRPIIEETLAIIKRGLSRPMFRYGRDRDTREEIISPR